MMTCIQGLARVRNGIILRASRQKQLDFLCSTTDTFLLTSNLAPHLVFLGTRLFPLLSLMKYGLNVVRS